MLQIAKVLRVANLSRRAARPLVTVIATLERMGRVATQRSALRLLDERQLKDIGLSRADALREADRHFWDLPRRSLGEGAAAASPCPRQECLHTGSRAAAQMPRAALPSG